MWALGDDGVVNFLLMKNLRLTLISFEIIPNLMEHPVSCVLGEYRFEKVPIPEPGPKEILVKVLAVGICAGDGKVLDGAERFWGKPGEKIVYFSRENSKSK